MCLMQPISSIVTFRDTGVSYGGFGCWGFLCVCALAFKKDVTTNVMDKLEGVRFYSSSATTDNEVLSTPFYNSNLKQYPVIGS